MLKRTLCIILIISVMLSLGACGGATPAATAAPAAATVEATKAPEATAEATKAPEETAAATAEATAATTEDWAAPFPEPVSIKVAYWEATGAVWSPGESQTDNMWTRRWKKLYNVDVVADFISIEYDTKLNLAIASGAIPDSFTCNLVQLEQLIAADLVQPLNDAYDKYASNPYKKMISENMDIMDVCSVDGKYMAMPMLHYGYECETSFIWYRQDWYKAAGEPVVKTVEQYEDLMTTFMKNNGAKQGLLLEKTLEQFFKTSAAFHAAPLIWVDAPDGSGLVYGATLPETKNQLAKYAEWYKKGFIRKDFASLDSAAMLEDANKGYAGTFTQANWAGWQVGKQLVDNQGAGTYFMGHDLFAVDDKKINYPIKFTNGTYEVVRKGYEHPEVLIKLISDYSLVLNDSIAAGVMTIDEVMPFGSNNMHHVTGPFKVQFASYKDTEEVHNAFMTGEEKFTTGYASLYYYEAKKWITDGDLTSLGRWLQMGTKDATLFLGNRHVDNDQIMKDKMWGGQPQEVLDLGTTLNDLLIEGYTKIIMGVEPIEYYDELITSWKKAGGDEVTAAVNAKYGKK